MSAEEQEGLGYRREPRRRYDAAKKLQMVAECDVPGATVAKVAQAHGVNANLLHKWRREQDGRTAALGKRSVRAHVSAQALTRGGEPAFVALALPTPVHAAGAGGADIRIAVRKAGTSVEVQWPSSAGDGCAAWLAQLLK